MVLSHAVAVLAVRLDAVAGKLYLAEYRQVGYARAAAKALSTSLIAMFSAITQNLLASSKHQATDVKTFTIRQPLPVKTSW